VRQMSCIVLDLKGVKQDHDKVIEALDEPMLDNGVFQSYSCGENLRLCVELRRNSAFWGNVDSDTQITLEINGESFVIQYYKAADAPEFMQQN
jgi:hypothetical protein